MSDQGVYGWAVPQHEESEGWRQVGASTPSRGVSLSTGGAVAAALGLLVVGAVAGAVVVIATIGFFSPPVLSLRVGVDGDLATFDLAAGDCATGVLDVAGQPATPQRVPCDEPHEVEVYAVTEPLPDGVYPDELSLDSYAYGWCDMAFEPFVGVDYWSSDLESWSVIPAGDAWMLAERRAACLVSTMDGSLLQGSVAGTAR